MLSGSHIKNEKNITLIIPLRMSPQLYEGEERLLRLLKNIPLDLMDVLIIDYGSDSLSQSWLQKVKVFPFVEVRQVQMPENTPFSIGHARDIGVQYAKTPVVMFHDIDFICNTEMYKKIYIEVVARGMSSDKGRDFFCVPVAFLNEKTTQRYIGQLSGEQEVFNTLVQQELITDSSNTCDFIAYGSSAIVVNRHNYLMSGGHSRLFFGHGAEDYDVLHRLSVNNPKADRPREYYTDTKSNLITSYEGFRAYFSLYGIDVFNKGVFMLHLWHPSRNIANYSQSSRNFKLLSKVMKSYDKNPNFHHPLQDKNITDKTLVFTAPNSAFVGAIREAIPVMGEVLFRDEKHFKSYKVLKDFIVENQITKLGFKNPYGNTHRLSLYKKIKEEGFPFWVMDRGALPHSWFFDPNGFNADSISYSRSQWEKELSEADEQSTIEYIETLKAGSDVLENNGSRVDLDILREQLSIKGRKVLFIPFQRPLDSVCQYFAGELGSAEVFNKYVESLSKQLGSEEWIVIGKKHPLEKYQPAVDGVVFVSGDMHIHDLIELSDVVCLLNSGVGVLSALFEKPVIYAGKAFYSAEGVNYYAPTVIEALKFLRQDLVVNKKTVHQFVYHLTHNVYSFGNSCYRPIIRKETGEKLNIVKSIRFRQIRGLTDEGVTIGATIKKVDLNEPLFYSFKKGLDESSESPSGAGVWMKKLIFSAAILVSRLFLNKNKVAKLKRNPALFFQDMKRNLVRKKS